MPGEVLVDADGDTLHLFEPDEAASVTRAADCADSGHRPLWSSTVDPSWAPVCART